jgi:hypothetical protein
MKRIVAALMVSALLAAACGGTDESRGGNEDPFDEIPHASNVNDPRTGAAPRWEKVETLKGTGASTARFSIVENAIQWRATWRCTSKGRIELALDPAPQEGNPIAEGRCPDIGSGFAIETGDVTLQIEADVPWRIVIEEQVDTALEEPPLHAMSAAGSKELAHGKFYGIERGGRGTATLYRLANERLALRMEGFKTSANTGLFVWVSDARRPRNTKQAFRSEHVSISNLKSTLGDQNYLLPRSIDAAEVRSIVIWCEPIRIAYAAASLTAR